MRKERKFCTKESHSVLYRANLYYGAQSEGGKERLGSLQQLKISGMLSPADRTWYRGQTRAANAAAVPQAPCPALPPAPEKPGEKDALGKAEALGISCPRTPPSPRAGLSRFQRGEAPRSATVKMRGAHKCAAGTDREASVGWLRAV